MNKISWVSVVFKKSALGSSLIAINKRFIQKKTVPPQNDDTSGLFSKVRKHLVPWDTAYQSFIQKNVDPKLLGKEHSQQLQALSEKTTQALSLGEKKANRKLLFGLSAFSFLARCYWLYGRL